jgi:hypothetical protein
VDVTYTVQAAFTRQVCCTFFGLRLSHGFLEGGNRLVDGCRMSEGDFDQTVPANLEDFLRFFGPRGAGLPLFSFTNSMVAFRVNPSASNRPAISCWASSSLLVIRLRADPSYPTEEARAFAALGGRL